MESDYNASDAVMQLLEENQHSAHPDRIAAAFIALICLGLIVGTLVAMGNYLGAG